MLEYDYFVSKLVWAPFLPKQGSLLLIACLVRSVFDQKHREDVRVGHRCLKQLQLKS